MANQNDLDSVNGTPSADGMSQSQGGISHATAEAARREQGKDAGIPGGKLDQPVNAANGSLDQGDDGSTSSGLTGDDAATSDDGFDERDGAVEDRAPDHVPAVEGDRDYGDADPGNGTPGDRR